MKPTRNFLFLFLLGIFFLSPLYAQSEQTFITNYLSGKLAEESGDFESAANLMQKSLNQAEKLNKQQLNQLYESLFNALMKSGQTSEALKYADKIIELNSPYAPIAQLLKLAENIKKTEWTKDTGAPLLQKEGAFGALLGGFIRVWGLVKIGNPTQALVNLRELNKSGGFEQILLYHEGNINLLTKKPKDALLLFKDQAPESMPLQLVRLYARALVADGKRKEASDLLNKIPNNEFYTIERDKEKLRDGKQLPPLVADAEAGLADGLARLATGLLGKFDEYALYIAMVGLYLDDKNDDLRIIVAEAAEGMKIPKLAKKYLEMIGENSDYYIEAQSALAEYYFDLPNKESALAVLQNLSMHFKEYDSVTMKLANAYRNVERFGEAEGLYTKLIGRISKLSPQHYYLYYARGICYERTDRFASAEADLLKALELNPDEPYVLNYLGYSWVDRGVNYERALPMLEKAVKLRESDGYIIDSLGWALYKIGRYQDAVVYLEKALNLVPYDPTITDHLGDISWVLGRHNQARLYWQRALDLAPEPKYITSIKQKLVDGL